MKEYEKISHFCYFNSENHHVLGVFPEECPALAEYPYEIINYKLAKPFYYGKKGFDGTYRLLKIKNKLVVVKEKPKTKVVKEMPKYSIYELNVTKNKKIDESDIVVEIKDNKAKIYQHLNINTYSETGIKIFTTTKNNPFFLIKKTVIPFNKKGYVKITNDNETLFDKSIFTKNINSKISLVENYQYFSKKPFLSLNIIELNQLIITANPQFYSIEKDFNNVSISVKEKYEIKKFNIDELNNSFHFVKDEKSLLSNLVYDRIDVSINEFPTYWLDVLTKEIIEKMKEINSTAVLYNSNSILVFSGNTSVEPIYIIPKNNPFKILHKVSTKTVLKNKNIDFDLSAVIICKLTNRLKMIPCERI